jgi:hypothetical protein
MSIKVSSLNGKSIAYTEETEFLVQVGRYSKGAYKTRYNIKGNLTQAVLLYNCINIGKGYKKRLHMPACSKNPILAKEAS